MADIICYKPDGQILDYYTQWDVGQQLMIKGVDLSSAPYFYFTNSISDTAYVMPSEVSGGAVVVNVPDVLLQDAMPLIVYISYSQDSYIGTTEHTVRIPVMPRAKPNDYIYNPDSGGSGSGSGGSTGEAVGIANNLTTNDSTMALSAAQGVVLKAMVDTLDSEKVDTDSLSDEIKSALDQAIADGEIVGGQGEPGKDGAPGKDGQDGRGIESVLRSSGDGSPGTIDIYTITYSDDTTSTFSVYNGADGKDGTSASGGEGVAGENGATFTPYVDTNGNLSWTNDKGLDNPETINIMGDDGISCTHSWSGTTLTVKSASGTSSADLKGADGADGVGITSVRQTVKSVNDDGDNVVTISLSDGTTSTITIQNGSKGSDGANGQSGNDGVSITNVEQTTTSTEDGGVNIITVTLSDGHLFTFEIRNGSKGTDGASGVDGVSPTVDVTDITDGKRLTITDINGSTTVDIMDGETGADGYTPVRGKDYYTDSDKSEMVDLVKSSMPEYMPVILTTDYYGTELPDPGVEGRLFFLIEA